MTKTRRSVLMRLGDRVVNRMLKLPAATTKYSVRRGIPIPMRDGAVLRADRYVPETATPAGTLLVRCPYGRGLPLSMLYARLYAQHGYHVVFQSCRGTFGSGGRFTPGMNEVDDGADTVDWLRRQPWFTGTFSTLGQSYLGATQWALLVDPPPELTAMVITVGPHDLWDFLWGTGSLAIGAALWWCDTAAHQEEGGIAAAFMRPYSAERHARVAAARLPWGESGRALLGDGAPWYEDWLGHPDRTDEYWRPIQLGAVLERLQVPVLLVSGWQDVFLGQTLQQYHRMRDRGVEVALTIGPWMHMDMMGRAAGTVAAESLQWFGQHLAPATGQARTSSVRIFLTGGPGWRDLPEWPVPSETQVLHLNTNTALTELPPRSDALPSRFTYDPADPTPTVGGPALSMSAGYRTDTALAERADVVSFTTEPLPRDTEVIGVPSVELVHVTDNPHADVFVRLSEVDPKGRSRNVTDGFVHLDAGRTADVTASVTVWLDAVAHRFRAGMRIRLMIAGGSHPRFGRNSGTDEPVLTGTTLRPSKHTIAHGAGGISRLRLPVH